MSLALHRGISILTVSPQARSKTRSAVLVISARVAVVWVSLDTPFIHSLIHTWRSSTHRPNAGRGAVDVIQGAFHRAQGRLLAPLSAAGIVCSRDVIISGAARLIFWPR